MATGVLVGAPPAAEMEAMVAQGMVVSEERAAMEAMAMAMPTPVTEGMEVPATRVSVELADVAGMLRRATPTAVLVEKAVAAEVQTMVAPAGMAETESERGAVAMVAAEEAGM